MLKDNWKFDAMYPMYVVEFQTNLNKLALLEASLESKNIKTYEEAQKVKSLSPFDFIRG